MSQFPGFTGGMAIPGMNTVLEGVENQPWFGEISQQIWLPDTISGAARDAGNTVTTLLRSGLLLGKVTATGLLKEWSPTGTDGSQDIHGVLGAMLLAQQSGSNQQRYVGFVQIGGNLYSDRIIIPGNAAEGIVGDANEFAVISQLRRRFLFDRHLTQLQTPLAGNRLIAKTADFTIVNADNGRHFTNIGASGTIIPTLPTAARGLEFLFSASAAQTMTITASGSDKIASSGSVTGTTYSLTTGKAILLVGISALLWQAIAIG